MAPCHRTSVPECHKTDGSVLAVVRVPAAALDPASRRGVVPHPED